MLQKQELIRERNSPLTKEDKALAELERYESTIENYEENPSFRDLQHIFKISAEVYKMADRFSDLVPLTIAGKRVNLLGRIYNLYPDHIL